MVAAEEVADMVVEEEEGRVSRVSVVIAVSNSTASSAVLVWHRVGIVDREEEEEEVGVGVTEVTEEVVVVGDIREVEVEVEVEAAVINSECHRRRRLPGKCHQDHRLRSEAFLPKCLRVRLRLDKEVQVAHPRSQVALHRSIVRIRRSNSQSTV
jgi:hypothetical protein